MPQHSRLFVNVLASGSAARLPEPDELPWKPWAEASANHSIARENKT